MIKNIIYLRTVFLYFLLLVLPNLANAVTAYPYPIEFTQPDGSKITVLLKGDEKIRWAETSDGYSLLFNKTATYEYAMTDENKDMILSGIQARNPEDRSNKEIDFLKTIPKKLFYSSAQIQLMKSVWEVYQTESQYAFPTSGSRNLVCILIGYQDKAFTKTQTDFNNLFNQINYTTGGATGSVKDYYLENSYNQLNLSVTVVGPYTASNTLAYYGANDVNGNDVKPRELITEAVNLADPAVNYANFDNDNDGNVDGVYVIYAGYGEEAGGGANAIWAHAWAIPTVTLDGKNINSYSCSPELSGNSGTAITNIGVICHEFGHVLGASDFYDIDGSANGQYAGTGNWDLMANGSWNNGGKTPAHHNAFTKTMVYAWASNTMLSSGSQITLNNAAENSNSYYRFNTTTSNEYFLIENRQQLKFDAYIPGHGMIIYHVDEDFINLMPSINTDNHQGMYPVCADATGNPPTTYGNINSGGCPFPGTGGKTSFTDATTPYSKSWAVNNTAKPITGISENNINKTVSFAFMGGITCTFPTIQASVATSSSLTDNSMTIGWTRGTGNSVIVVARQGNPITDLPINSTNYSSNAVFGTGDQIGIGNYVVYNGTGTSVNITALMKGTSYYYSIYEYMSASNCYLTPALTVNTSTTGTALCTYCISSGNIDYQTSISQVIFNTIGIATGKTSGYIDNTGIRATVNKGSTYNLTVNVNTDGNYNVSTLAWIDWNQDCDFLDADEAYNLGIAFNVVNGVTQFSPLNITIPINSLTGITRMRIATKFYIAPTSCETNYDGEVEDYSINVLPPVLSTFTAAIDNDWNNNGNWDYGIPSAITNTVIPANKLAVINSPLNTCNHLTIAASGKLTINTSQSLTVNGDLTLQSDNSATASLITLGTLSVTGTKTIERYIAKDNSWHFLSTPIDNQAIIPAFAPTIPNAYFDFYKWNETIPISGNVWVNIKNIAGNYVSGFNTFENGRGYLVAYSSSYGGSATHSFSGNLNNGDQLIAVTNVSNKYNLIGNPYPSSIDWDITGYTNRNVQLKNANPSIWIWNGASGNYGTYTNGMGTNSVTNIIAPHQGFFVEANTSGSFTIPNSARIHPAQNFMKTNQTDLLRLKVSSAINTYSDEIVINFNNNSTAAEGVVKWFSMIVEAPSLFSIKNNLKYSINTLPELNDNVIVPVGFVAGLNGNYNITVSGIQSFGNVILEDLKTGIQHNLASNNIYSFNALTNDLQNRFLLYIKSVGIGELTEETPKIDYNQFTISVFNPWLGKTNLDIYDLNGRIIHSFDVKEGVGNYIFKSTSGVYLFKMVNDKHIFVKKEIIY